VFDAVPRVRSRIILAVDGRRIRLTLEDDVSDPSQRVTRERFDAVLFDLDGVLTDTARIHADCWKTVFDEFLRRRAEAEGEPLRPFDIDGDYRLHVDGRPRLDGVRGFLASRGIVLPEGAPGDPPGAQTVFGLGNRKNELVNRALATQRVEPYQGSVAWLRALRGEGFRAAVVSASRNCAAVLEAAQIAHFFDARVDGEVTAALGLPGKPAPDSFLEAARRLGVEARRAVVVEDALAGVQAGREGGFGLVIGVARKDDAEALARNGADLVVNDLSELLA
jgi:beta-phosphoglucomutase family hydrolase